PIAQKIAVRLVVADPKTYGGAEQLLMKLVGAERITLSDQRGEVAKTDIHLVCEGAEAFIPLASLVDLAEERARIEKEIERIKGEIARADGKLSNEKFVQRAPEAVVNEERRKRAVAVDMLETLQKRRADLN
ncbi:MAG: valine--tRNA ligase, partial [Clostridia bacterium]|nr:valine--tRNA ligase [Clostridia bacterium]